MPRPKYVQDTAQKMSVLKAFYGVAGTKALLKKVRPDASIQALDAAYGRYANGDGIDKTAAIELAKLLNMPLHDFRGPWPRFLKAMLDSHSLTTRLQKEFLNSEQDLITTVEKYKGLYFGWMRWVNLSEPNKSFLKILLKIEDVDLFNRVIKVKYTTPLHRDSYYKNPYEWGWAGFMSLSTLTGNLFCVFGNIHRVTSRQGYVSIFFREYENTLNKESVIELVGIYSTEPRGAHQPTATRIFLRRLDEMTNEEQALREMGYFSEDEISNDIKVGLITNTINTHGLLPAYEE